MKEILPLQGRDFSDWSKGGRWVTGPGSCFSLLLLQSLETALKYCNYMFTTVFVLEAVLKLVAFGLRRFFKDR